MYLLFDFETSGLGKNFKKQEALQLAWYLVDSKYNINLKNTFDELSNGDYELHIKADDNTNTDLIIKTLRITYVTF